MDQGRRTVIKGMLSGGAVVTLGGLPLMKAAASPPTTQRVLLLLPEGAAGVSLLQALQASAALRPQRIWHLPAVPDQRLLRCTAALQQLAGPSCLALLSEANIVLLREWARSAGKGLLGETASLLPASAGTAPDRSPDLPALGRALLAPALDLPGRTPGRAADRVRLASLALQL